MATDTPRPSAFAEPERRLARLEYLIDRLAEIHGIPTDFEITEGTLVYRITKHTNGVVLTTTDPTIALLTEKYAPNCAYLQRGASAEYRTWSDAPKGVEPNAMYELSVNRAGEAEVAKVTPVEDKMPVLNGTAEAGLFTRDPLVVAATDRLKPLGLPLRRGAEATFVTGDIAVAPLHANMRYTLRASMVGEITVHEKAWNTP